MPLFEKHHNRKNETMPFAETHTGATLHYEHLNPNANGVPVLVLHGLLGTGRTDLGHVLDWLADEGYEVLAPSLRGYGESTPKPRDFPYRFYDRDAEDVLAFLEALDIGKVHILGYSDGGETALTCAGKQPERFVTVAAIGAGGYIGAEVRPRVMGYRPGSQWITPEEIELHGIPDPDKFSAQWVRSTVMLIDSGGDIAMSNASKITAPVLIMLGERDGLNPRIFADKFIAQVQNGRVVMFDAGHPVHNEQTEEFRKVYLAHLQND
jgi:valacyclovir hydrolase